MTLKILVAEDDRHTRRILDHIFTKDPAFRDQDTELFLAPDGEEALKIFEKEAPDLVISDLLMPRLDGFALCRAIRRLPHGKDVPVIVTSAIYKETALLNRMRDELGVEFFAKPFQVRELVRGVQRLLEKRQRSGRGGTRTATAQATPKRATGTLGRVQGELAKRPLAALLLDLLEDEVTGVLTLRRGRIKKEIYIIHGVPVGAESNIRTETLGHYLVAKRVLDEQQHQHALAHAKEHQQSIMQAVAALGWLSETDVFRHHTALVKLKIINSLRWHDGTYGMSPGDTFSDRIPKATIDITNILLLGLQRVTSLDEVSRALDAVANQSVRLRPRAERYRDSFVKVFGDEVLKLLPSQPTINEMLRKGVDSLAVYLHTHALLETGMAELGEAREDGAAPVRTEDPIGLKHLKQEATRAPEKKKAASTDPEEGTLYEEIFGVDEISVVTAMPEPERPHGRPPVDSGEVSIDIPIDDGGLAGSDQLSTAEARKLVVSTYLGIHEKDHYQLLGVERTAGTPEIRAAFGKQQETFAVDRFVDCDLGLDHPKLEEINHLLRSAYECLMDPGRRATYDEELRRREASAVDPLEAEARFQQGQQHLAANRPDQAVTAFSRALELDPDSADYRAHLGWATFLSRPSDPESHLDAVGHLDQALAMNPDERSALVFYGRICARTDNTANAVQYLERALDVDPADEEAFGELAAIHATHGDWKLLERQHRLVLHRLGSRQTERVLEVWKSLASVYLEHLQDPESARTALEVAASLAPEDTEVRAALEELDRPDPRQWKEAAAELRDRFSARPEDPTPVQELYRLYDTAGQTDAAYVAAAVLTGLGAAPEAAAELHTRFRPRFLIRIRRDMDAELWARIRHPDDDPDTGALFETLARLPEDFDFELPPLVEGGPPVPLDELPEPFRRVLSYLCGLLGLPAPPVIVRDAADRPMTLYHPLAPRLLVDRALVASEDTLTLGVHLALLLPYLWAGRAFGITMGSKQLRNVLMGAMKVVAPRLKVDDPNGTIGRIHERLMGAPAPLRTQLAEVITGLTRERSSLNITRWMRGLAQSANRLALVVAADPELVLANHPRPVADTEAELRRYALSEEHLEIREILATSIAV